MIEQFEPCKLQLSEEYKISNPNIISLIKNDLEQGNPFHYLFTGMVGSGKTYLGQQIVQSCVESTKWQLLSTIRQYEQYLFFMQSNYDDKWDAIRKSSNEVKKQCLMLDDLGDEKPSTPAAHDYFGGLIEKRHLMIKRNPNSRTIITTNLNADMIRETYGSRVLDRMIEHFVICKFKRISFREMQERIVEE